MDPIAIAFMIIGLCITWGGLAYALSKQIKDSKANKEE